MANANKVLWRELLADVQQRVPAGQRVVQEAFTSDHRHSVLVKLSDAQPDTFYWFDEITACAFFDAVVDWAGRQAVGRLTVSYTAFGEVQAQSRRLQHVASKLDAIRVLAVGKPAKDLAQVARLECSNTTGTALVQYRLALAETQTPLLFVARETLATASRQRSLGFFSADSDIVEEIADDVVAVLGGNRRRLESFEKLQLIHQTTQQVARELESYSRRMELAVQRARRRPDLLTPARFDRIVGQAIIKMEQLQDIPRRALRTMGRPPKW